MKKNFKRLITLFVAAVICITSIGGVTFAASVDNMDSGEAFKLLSSLGFFTYTENYAENHELTRIAVIDSIINAMPEEKVFQYRGTAIGFEDVTPTDAIAKNAYNAYLYKLLGDETMLRPFEIADLEFACGVLVNLLGVRKENFDNASYYDIASTFKITSGVSRGEKLTMATYTKLLLNIFDVEAPKVTIKSDVVTYNLEAPKGTFLENVLHIGRDSGVVNANCYGAINGTETVRENELKINYTDYTVKGYDCDEYLGHFVDIYYRFFENGDKSDIKYMSINDGKSSVKVDAEDIENFTPSDMTYTYVYGKDLNKRKKITVPKSAEIIYNGVNIYYPFSDYRPVDGNVEFIDNDGKGGYDVVKITSYKTVIVNAVSITTGTITDIYDAGNKVTLNLNEDPKRFEVYDTEGNRVLLSTIHQYDVLFVAADQSENKHKIIINREKVEGFVEALWGDKVKINGITYKIRSDFNKELEVDNYGTFYLDPNGKIAGFQSSSGMSIKSGYIINVAQINEAFKDDALKFKIFTDADKVEELMTAETFYFTNGKASINPAREKVTDMSEVYNALRDDKGNVINQLVLFKKNADGEMSELKIAVPYSADTTAEQVKAMGDTFRDATGRLNNINHKTGKFKLSAQIGPNTKVYNIPSNLDFEDDFKVYTGTKNCFAWNTEYNVECFYSSVDSPYMDFVLNLSGSTESVDENYVFIVESVGEGLDKDGNVVKSIHGVWGTTEKSFTLDEDLSEMIINDGDVLRLAIDEYGSVIAMTKAFDSVKREYKNGSGGLGGKYTDFYGDVYKMNGTRMQVYCKQSLDTVDPSEVKESDLVNMYTQNFPTIYRYDTRNKKLEVADMTDVSDYCSDSEHYSQVFAWFYYADHKIMVIYD